MTAAPELRVASEPPEGWDELVRGHPRGTFCHLSAWGDVFGRVFGHRPLYLSAHGDGGGLRGVLPLTEMPTLKGGRVLVSMPYLNYGGALGDDEAVEALEVRALDEAKERGARRLELRRRHAPSSPGGDARLGPGRDKVTVLLDLPDEPDTLFVDRFRSKLRSQIRRPMKEDMEVRFGPEQVEPFFEIFSRNMRDLGTPVLPRGLFSAVLEAFPEEADFGAVYHEGRPVAAGGGFHHGEEFEMTWASSLRELNRLSPNMLLYWGFMERCIERGRRTFNFGRCTPGGGTHRFKSQWGGEDQELAWLEWPAGTAAPDPEEGVYDLASRLWQRLPLPLANRLGPMLARRIPTF